MKNVEEIAKEAIKHYGIKKQLLKLDEEYSELIVAVKNYSNRRDIATEIADVMITMYYPIVYLGLVDEFKQEITKQYYNQEKHIVVDRFTDKIHDIIVYCFNVKVLPNRRTKEEDKMTVVTLANLFRTLIYLVDVYDLNGLYRSEVVSKLKRLKERMNNNRRHLCDFCQERLDCEDNKAPLGAVADCGDFKHDLERTEEDETIR